MSVTYSGAITIQLYWTELKTIVLFKNLLIQYQDDGAVINVFSIDGPITQYCIIYNGIVPDFVMNNGYSQEQNDLDKADFTNNFKSSTNTVVQPLAKIGNSLPTAASLIGGSDGYNLQALQVTATNELKVDSAVLDKRFGVVTLGTPQLVNASGDTTIHTPTSGKSIRLKWFAMSTPDTNTGAVIVTVKLNGSDLYKWPMGAPGAFMHSSVREGSVNGILSINLSSAQDVYVNMDLEEF